MEQKHWMQAKYPNLNLQVGKSAFVRAMLRDMGQFDSTNFDPAAMSNGRYLPVESAMPGTTLGIIPLQAFASGGTLYGERQAGHDDAGVEMGGRQYGIALVSFPLSSPDTP